MIHYRTTNSLTEAFIAKQKLLDLQHLYPDFNYWFSNKCLPGIVIGSDKMIIAKHDEQIIGLAIGKVSDNETKLRCVRVRFVKEDHHVSASILLRRTVSKGF